MSECKYWYYEYKVETVHRNKGEYTVKICGEVQAEYLRDALLEIYDKVGFGKDIVKIECRDYSTAYLFSKVDQNKIPPVCPNCSERMIIKRYSGYYDSFQYWACKCDLPYEDYKEIFYGAHSIARDAFPKMNKPQKVKDYE